MAVIIFIIILAVGYALCGDTSGIEMIGKGILFIALFLGIGWIIIEIPWLLALVVVGVIIWAVASTNKNNDYLNDDSTCDYQEKIYENETVVRPVTNPTSFQSELQQNTKTPQQVMNEQWARETEQAKQSANADYNTIKRELLHQAENGNYSTLNGHKNITFDHKYRWMPSFIGYRTEGVYINKTILNPGGEYANKLTIFVTNQAYYNAYISEIKKLCKTDGISVTPLMIDKKNPQGIYTLPFTIQGFGVYDDNYEFVLRCRVQY